MKPIDLIRGILLGICEALKRKLNSYKLTPVSVHAGNRSFLRVFQHFPKSAELDFYETVQIPVSAEAGDPLAFRENVRRAGAARRQARMLARPEAQLLVPGGQLHRADPAALD